MSGNAISLVQIARVLKSNGSDGELVLGFLDWEAEDIDRQEPVYIHFDGIPVPFFFEDYRIKGRKGYARLTGISCEEDALEVIGKDVFIHMEDDDDEEGLEGLVGWTLKDSDGDVKGEITGVEDIPGNPCIYIGESLVPLHEDLVIEMDPDKKILRMNIPEGLL